MDSNKAVMEGAMDALNKYRDSDAKVVHAVAPDFDEDEDEIDLLELWRYLLRFWYVVAVSAVICGVAAFFCSRFFIAPQYESTATMYILTRETTLTSLADLQIGSQLTNDYAVVVKNRTVLDRTIEELGIGGDKMTFETLSKAISTENPSNTRMLKITASNPDPQLAMDIANTVAKNASEFIADTMEITPPKVIEKGVLAETKSSPNNTRNGLIGAAAGFVLAGVILVIRFLMNDAVITEEDVTKYLSLPVLALLPDRTKGEGNSKLQRKNKRAKLSQSRKNRFVPDQITNR